MFSSERQLPNHNSFYCSQEYSFQITILLDFVRKTTSKTRFFTVLKNTASKSQILLLFLDYSFQITTMFCCSQECSFQITTPFALTGRQLPNHDYCIFYCCQEYSFQITMRQEWNDRRLSYEERLTSKMKGNLCGIIKL